MLREALARVAASAPRAVVHLRGSLRRNRDATAERRMHADAALAHGRRVTREHARAQTPLEAIELLVRQLQREISEQRRQETSARRRSGSRRQAK
jgi:hypothetical protein